MSAGRTPETPVKPEVAYPYAKRLADMDRFVAFAAANGFLEQTNGKRVAETYGVEHTEVRAAKAKYRNELSFGEGK